LIENCEHDFDILTAPLPEGENEISSPQHRIIRKDFLVSSHNPTSFQLFKMYLYLAFFAIKIGVKREYDLVVFYTSAIGNGFFSLLFRVLNVRVILMAFAEEITLAEKAPGLKGALKRFFMKNGYPYAYGFVSICHFAKDLIARMGVDEERICVIPTPILPSKNLPTSHDNNREGYEILSVGRLIRRKGFNYLIDAVDMIKEDIPDVHFTIVGDGDEMEPLVNQVKTSGLSENVTFAGPIYDDAKMSQMYSQCDLFVLANLMLENGDCEGSPNVLIEASAHGKPVIGGREGGTATAVDEGPRRM